MRLVIVISSSLLLALITLSESLVTPHESYRRRALLKRFLKLAWKAVERRFMTWPRGKTPFQTVSLRINPWSVSISTSPLLIIFSTLCVSTAVENAFQVGLFIIQNFERIEVRHAATFGRAPGKARRPGCARCGRRCARTSAEIVRNGLTPSAVEINEPSATNRPS